MNQIELSRYNRPGTMVSISQSRRRVGNSDLILYSEVPLAKVLQEIGGRFLEDVCDRYGRINRGD